MNLNRLLETCAVWNDSLFFIIDVERYTVFLFHQIQLGADTSTHKRNAQAEYNGRQGLRHHSILHQVVQTRFKVSVDTVVTFQTPYMCDIRDLYLIFSYAAFPSYSHPLLQHLSSSY